jgi:hypothetical protein
MSAEAPENVTQLLRAWGDGDRNALEQLTPHGTDIGRVGPMLLADRYDDRTHFIA